MKEGVKQRRLKKKAGRSKTEGGRRSTFAVISILGKRGGERVLDRIKWIQLLLPRICTSSRRRGNLRCGRVEGKLLP